MPGVFRDVTIEWEGEEYTFTPSNRLIRSIESAGVKIVGLLREIETGEISVSNFSYVMAAFLRAGGASVTEDQAYQVIMTSDEGKLAKLVIAFSEAITPQGLDEKKPAARRTTKPRAKPRARKQAKQTT